MMQKVAWKAKKTSCGIVGPFARGEVDAVEEGVAEAADDAAVAVEGERVADRGPGDGGDGDRGDAHHEGVEGVLRAHQAGVEEAQRRGHHQHQRRRDQHPGGVAGVDPGDRGGQPASRSLVHRRHGAVVGVAGADAHRPLQRQDEDLAVADLAGAGALAERVDGGLDERRRRRRSRSGPSPRAPSSRWCRGRSRPGRARRRGPARG